MANKGEKSKDTGRLKAADSGRVWGLGEFRVGDELIGWGR